MMMTSPSLNCDFRNLDAPSIKDFSRSAPKTKKIFQIMTLMITLKMIAVKKIKRQERPGLIFSTIIRGRIA